MTNYKLMTSKFVSYFILIFCTLITILPLFWMAYSSFKSNEEITRDIYAFPKELFWNNDDKYVIIKDSISLVRPYNTKKDTRERLIIESTTISSGKKVMVYYLIKDKLPEKISRLNIGDTFYLRELPLSMRIRVSWQTAWFNYRAAFEKGGLGLKFLNSILYTVVSTFLIVILGLMIAFGLTKFNYKKISLFIMGFIGLGYLISQQSVIIPLFLMMSSLNLTDTHIGIILVYTAFGLPLAVLLMTQFMKGLPNSLIESAEIDGSNMINIFIKIISPMCIPVVVTVIIFSALGIWNEFLLVLVLASSKATKSLPVGVYSFTSIVASQLGWQMAALVIATFPTIIAYLIFQKQLNQNVVGGAIKG